MSADPSALCPSCNKPLEVCEASDHWFVFCAYGPCKSKRANMGDTGPTLEVAHMNLVRAIEAEQEQQASD